MTDYPIIHRNVEQGSDAWHKLRLGVPTTSEFKSILAKGQGAMRKRYLYTIAAERLTDRLGPSFTNKYMDRGQQSAESIGQNTPSGVQ